MKTSPGSSPFLFQKRLICVASLFLLLPLFLIFLHLCVTCLLNEQDSVVYNWNIPLFISTLACHHVIFVLPTTIPGNIPGKVTFLVTFGIRISKVLRIKKFSPIYYQNFHLSLNPELAPWPPFPPASSSGLIYNFIELEGVSVSWPVFFFSSLYFLSSSYSHYFVWGMRAEGQLVLSVICFSCWISNSCCLWLCFVESSECPHSLNDLMVCCLLTCFADIPG